MLWVDPFLDWEKQWKQNPQKIIKPAVVQVDFQETHGAARERASELAETALVRAN